MKTQIYQICYSQGTLAQVPEGFLTLDNTENTRADWREYWPIRNFLLNNYLSDDVLYGFLSPKFQSKTLLNHNSIQQFLDLHYQNEDVVSFSPFWDLTSIFKNIYEQGDFFHPGLAHVCKLFCDQFAAGLDTRNAITHSQNTIFCNYFLAKKSFWNEWLNLGEKLFQCAEQNASPLANELNQTTTYGVQQLPMKIFVQERIATSALLLNSEIKCLAYNMFNTGPSTTPFNQFLNEAVISDSLKMSYTRTKHPIYLNQFGVIRDGIISKMRTPIGEIACK
jgi:hypothetical protein